MDGKTLIPRSPEITISRIRVSLGASAFIVGTRTEVVAAPAPGATAGLGLLIMLGLGGIGGAVATVTTDTPAEFEGLAIKHVAVSGLWTFCAIAVIAF